MTEGLKQFYCGIMIRVDLLNVYVCHHGALYNKGHKSINTEVIWDVQPLLPTQSDVCEIYWRRIEAVTSISALYKSSKNSHFTLQNMSVAGLPLPQSATCNISLFHVSFSTVPILIPVCAPQLSLLSTASSHTLLHCPFRPASSHLITLNTTVLTTQSYKVQCCGNTIV